MKDNLMFVAINLGLALVLPAVSLAQSVPDVQAQGQKGLRIRNRKGYRAPTE